MPSWVRKRKEEKKGPNLVGLILEYDNSNVHVYLFTAVEIGIIGLGATVCRRRGLLLYGSKARCLFIFLFLF